MQLESIGIWKLLLTLLYVISHSIASVKLNKYVSTCVYRPIFEFMVYKPKTGAPKNPGYDF